MNPSLIIIGASGHGKVVADAAALSGYENIVFLDDFSKQSECGGFPVLGTTEKLAEYDAPVIIAIGNAHVRSEMMRRFSDRVFATVVHPSAIIASTATIGDGTFVAAGSVINPDVRIGKGVIINTSASVDHDCAVSDYSHVSVGAHLCGTVNVGEKVWIGAGATVINNISICSDCMIGAGAVVTKDIDRPGIYYGVPAIFRKESWQ